MRCTGINDTSSFSEQGAALVSMIPVLSLNNALLVLVSFILASGILETGKLRKKILISEKEIFDSSQINIFLLLT